MKIVNIVHAIDTEGPLHEPLEATFARLAEIFRVTNVKCSRDNSKNKEIDLGGKEESSCHTKWTFTNTMILGIKLIICCAIFYLN